MVMWRAIICAVVLGAGNVSAAFLEKQSEGASIEKQLADLREQEQHIAQEEQLLRQGAGKQALKRSTVSAEEDAEQDADVIRKQLSRQQAIIEQQKIQAQAAQAKAAQLAKELAEKEEEIAAEKQDMQQVQPEEEKKLPQAAAQESLAETEETSVALQGQLEQLMMAVGGGAFVSMPLESIGIWRDFAFHMQKALAGQEPTSNVEAFVELHKDADANLPKVMSIVEKLSQLGDLPEGFPESLEVIKRSMLLAGELRKPKHLQQYDSAVGLLQKYANYLPSPQEDESIASAMLVAQKIDSLSKKVEGSDVSLMEAFHDSMMIARERTQLEDAWKMIRADLRAHRVSEAMEDATMPQDVDKLREEIMHLRMVAAKEGVTLSEEERASAEGTGALFQAASHGSSMISLAGEQQKQQKRDAQMHRIVSALGHVEEDIKANHEHLQKMKERAAKLAPELAGMNKLLTGAGKELRSRDAAWAHKMNGDMAQKSNEMSSLLQTSQSNLQTSKQKKLEHAGRLMLRILTEAAESARETLPISRSDEDEVKFVEKFSSSLNEALQAHPHLRLGPKILDNALEHADVQLAASQRRSDAVTPLMKGLPSALMQRSSIAAPMDNHILYADEFGKLLYRAMYK